MKLRRIASGLLGLALLAVACAPPATPTDVVEPTTPPEPTTPAEPTEVPTVAVVATSTPAPDDEPLPEGVVNLLTVNLRTDIVWSDGTPLTAQDLAGTYDLLWARQDAIWTFLQDVVVVDDDTLDFQFSVASPRALRLVLRGNQPVPPTLYGDFMTRAAELRESGVDPAEDADVAALVEELNAFAPEEVIVYGPFNLDLGSITEAELRFVKNPTGYNADAIGFDTFVVYQGETTSSVPLVLAGQLDYSTHGYTPSDVTAFEALDNIEVIRGPNGTGPGLWFNESIEPFNEVAFRQAVAYVINREENAAIAMGESGRAVEYLAGFSDLLVPQWLSDEVIDQLNRYETDPARAEELLTGIGLARGSDNLWRNATGEVIELNLSVPSDFADWLGAAENAAQQLNNFGLQTTVRGYNSSERSTTILETNYEILVDVAMRTNPPHPNSAFRSILTNGVNNANNPEAEDGSFGMNWPWTQVAPDGSEVYIPELVDLSIQGLDPEAQRPYVETLALIYNEQLPVVPLFERYSNDPINTDRVEGWLPLDDPLYQNNQGGDNYVAIQLLAGTLAPTDANPDRSFATSWPYPQPPNYSLNLFSTTALPQFQGVGTPGYHLLYPPLFWYVWAEGQYVPVIAESYSLR